MVIKCKDCNHLFCFSDSEKEFDASKKWDDPVRCKCCREKHKEKLKDPYYGLYESMFPYYRKKKRHLGLPYYRIEIR